MTRQDIADLHIAIWLGFSLLAFEASKWWFILMLCLWIALHILGSYLNYLQKKIKP